MQLDINPEWPTLITYTHHGGLDPVKVVPNYQQPATRYLVPDDRDFFAVYRRVPGPRHRSVQVTPPPAPHSRSPSWLAVLCTSAATSARQPAFRLRVLRFVDQSRRAHFRDGTSGPRVLVTYVRYPDAGVRRRPARRLRPRVRA